MTDLVLTVPEAAARLGVSDWLIYDLIKKKKFPHRRLGRRIVIPVHALERWADDTDTAATS
jgi:excisionase family DNA binding protein